MRSTYLTFCILFLILLFNSCEKDDIETATSYKDGEVEIVFENDKDRGINFVFMADAYLESQLEIGNSTYRTDALRLIDHVFSVEPFTTYKEHFNVYIVYAVSEDFKLSDDSQVFDTAFSLSLDSKDWNKGKVAQYARKANDRYDSTNDVAILFAQGSSRAGRAVFSIRQAVITGTIKNTTVHEIGHAFARLGDEYEIENSSPTLTTQRPNLDITDDPSTVKWNHFIGLPGYESVSTYEGGGFVSEGIWRPELESVMRTSRATTNFNAPSREAIVKKISAARGIAYSFESFLEKDVIPDSNRNAQEEALDFSCHTF